MVALEVSYGHYTANWYPELLDLYKCSHNEVNKSRYASNLLVSHTSLFQSSYWDLDTETYG